jgi:hypothetical protein
MNLRIDQHLRQRHSWAPFTWATWISAWKSLGAKSSTCSGMRRFSVMLRTQHTAHHQDSNRNLPNRDARPSPPPVLRVVDEGREAQPAARRDGVPGPLHNQPDTPGQNLPRHHHHPPRDRWGQSPMCSCPVCHGPVPPSSPTDLESCLHRRCVGRGAEAEGRGAEDAQREAHVPRLLVLRYHHGVLPRIALLHVKTRLHKFTSAEAPGKSARETRETDKRVIYHTMRSKQDLNKEPSNNTAREQFECVLTSVCGLLE